MKTHMSEFNLLYAIILLLAIVCPSYQLYHALKDDIKIETLTTVIKKSVVVYGKNRYFDLYITYKDNDSIIHYEKVDIGQYYATPISSKVILKLNNPDINQRMISIAYIEYLVSFVIGIIVGICKLAD